jgi:hypothetical protein
MIYTLTNVTVGVGFCILSVWQYHVGPTLSYQIDSIAVPWLWFVAFFVASILSLRGVISKAVLVSFLSAGLSSIFLYLVIHLILAPAFDPW